MTKNRIIGLIVLVLLVIIGIIIWKIPQKSNNNTKNLEEDKIAIMVFDKNQNKYVKQDNFPVGYTLSSSSYCTNGTPVGTYDSSTGTMTTSFNKSDKCYYYFEELPLTLNSITDRSSNSEYIISIDVTGGVTPYTYYYNLLDNGCFGEYKSKNAGSSNNNPVIVGNVMAIGYPKVEIYVIDAAGNRSETKTLSLYTSSGCPSYGSS